MYIPYSHMNYGSHYEFNQWDQQLCERGIYIYETLEILNNYPFKCRTCLYIQKTSFFPLFFFFFFILSKKEEKSFFSSPQECSFSLWVRLSYTIVGVVVMDSDFLDKLSKISLTKDQELDIVVRVTHRKEILEE